MLAGLTVLPLAADDLATDQVAHEVLSAMDRTADPCEDFYRYSCGGWLDSTPLPSDKPRWTRSFSVIRESNREFVRGLLEEAAADPGDDPNRQKVGHY